MRTTVGFSAAKRSKRSQNYGLDSVLTTENEYIQSIRAIPLWPLVPLAVEPRVVVAFDHIDAIVQIIKICINTKVGTVGTFPSLVCAASSGVEFNSRRLCMFSHGHAHAVAEASVTLAAAGRLIGVVEARHILGRRSPVWIIAY